MNHPPRDAPAPDGAAVTPGGLFRLVLLHGGRGVRLTLTTLAFMAHQLCEALVPIVVGLVIDRAIAPGDPSALLRWLTVLAGVFVVLSLSYQRAAASMVTVYGYAEHELRQATVTRLLDPRGLRRRPGPGEALAHVTSDTYRVAGVSWSVVEQAATLTAILTASVALLLISVPLGIGVIVSTVLVLVLMRRLSMPLEARGHAEQGSAARAGEVATDMITGLRVLVGMNARAEAAARYRTASDSSRRGAVAAARAVLAYTGLSVALSGVFLAALATAAGLLALDGQLTVGQLVTVLGLAQFLQGSLAHVGTFAANWSHKRASARRLADLLNEPPAAPGPDTPAPGPDTPADLVWHPPGHGTPVKIPTGTLLGVVPRHPAHARDLSDRLGHRVPPPRGELLIGGRDAADLGPDGVRAHITAPPHHGSLFSGTLRANLTPPGGIPDPALLRAAALDDVLEHLGGPDAEVGEEGRRLSGGQRQRLLLARALHADTPVRVLDEPATAVDPVTERRIAEGLRALTGTTVLITTSRILLSTCDQVIDLSATPGAPEPNGTPPGAPEPNGTPPGAPEPNGTPR
ncbi:ABC transporter transmembrane domain-containing protein [Streptomyces sp. NPDC059578]|uniref:ABC transporter transmembrane domain-containing protein n=1 Tax=Streptomyces sp. NPDC059578 TaxID=3346874 RepID=UPI0036A03D51